jgi:hypothetical protein
VESFNRKVSGKEALRTDEDLRRIKQELENKAMEADLKAYQFAMVRFSFYLCESFSFQLSSRIFKRQI